MILTRKTAGGGNSTASLEETEPLKMINDLRASSPRGVASPTLSSAPGSPSLSLSFRSQLHPSQPGAPTSGTVLKPFFIMDWLDEIDPEDLEKAQRMLSSSSSSTPRALTPATAVSTSKMLPVPPPPPLPSAVPHRPCPIPARQQARMTTLEQVQKDLFPSLSLRSAATATNNTSALGEDLVDFVLLPPTASTQPSLSSSSVPSTAATSTATSSTMNVFRRRSIALGNGWNARGLQAAKRGSWSEALRCWTNALEIRTQVLGQDHLDVANTCNNIGIALSKLSDRNSMEVVDAASSGFDATTLSDPNKPDEALSYLDRALTIRIKHYGTRQHPQVAATLHNMGNVLQHYGDLAAALDCFDEARRLLMAALGPHHVQVARAMVAMGHTYFQSTQYEHARDMYRAALSIMEGQGSSSTAPTAEDHPNDDGYGSPCHSPASYHAEARAIRADLQDLEQFLLLQQE